MPGLSPNVDSIIANPVPIDSPSLSGRKYYTYTLQQDFRFATAGTYKIPFSYTHPDIDACNNTETDTLVIIVRQGPVANFNFTNPVCLKDTVYFTGTSNLNGFTINNHLWNFDDATTQNTVDAKKLFLTAGTQNVRYRIFATNGCVGDTTKAVNINPNPLARLGITSTICQRDSALVTDTSSIGAGTIASLFYSFGDGNTFTQNAPFVPFYHRYANPGMYTVKMVATSNNGCKSDTSYGTVTVNPSPVAKFGYDRNICVGDSIRITDTSNIVGGSILSWHYNFGDGNTLIRNNNTPFYHTFSTAGNFVVSLVTVSNLGCPSDTFRRTVTVANKPVATFSFTGRPCVDSNFVFTSSYTNTVNTTWHWNFGDGQIQNSNSGNTATHTYANMANNITVRHAVSIGQGCTSDTAFAVIAQIKANPIADFSIDETVICAGDSVQFTASIGGIATWLWNFGNGSGNQIPPFVRAYNTLGSYNISLTVRDTSGCGSLPETELLLVGPVPNVNAGADKFVQTGGSILLDAQVSPAGVYTYLWTPATGLNNPNILQPLANPTLTTTYLLVVEDPVTLCKGRDSVTVNVISKLFIPNAFTPNGDGKNDFWRIPGMALYPDGVVRIFNRYGQKVYESKAYQNKPWDGSFKGTAVPNGGYVYFIQLNNDTKETIKGTVLVIR